MDVRIIAATHRNLEERVADGSFREDLFYRLNVFPIHVPPLRERTEDIPLLVWHFVREFSEALGKRIDSIAPATMAQLTQHSMARKCPRTAERRGTGHGRCQRVRS